MFLNEIEPGEVLQLLQKTDIKKASDIYGFSPKLIKIAAPAIYETLTSIFNKSFELGQFPEKMKFAKVIPIHKGGSKTNMFNYRPIYLLPIFSKILEKVMRSHIMNFW